MTPVYLPGRGLVCALGLDAGEAVAALSQAGRARTAVSLPGAQQGRFPFRAIARGSGDWYERARSLVQKVALEAGAAQARAGALFIATSSFDVGAVEQGAAGMNYATFTDKVASWLDWAGPVYVISTACTSSLNAMIVAHALLGAGEVEDALVLGIELDNRLTLGGFAALQLLSPTNSKPFSAQRDGLVLGEAVAALRLSTREPSRWKLLGGASVVDGRQPTGASAAAVAAMYRGALQQAGLPAEAIDLIKVQAAGSPGNDAAEAQGLGQAFSRVPPLISLKPAIGHTMGASGAAEVALLTACLDQGVWPAYTHAVDEALGVDLVAQRPDSVRHVMASILGFGGSHATVVLGCA